MIVTIHQPNFLPWLGYFHKIYHSDTFVLLDDVQYTKSGLTARSKIKGSQGWQWLTVPILIKGRYGQNINDVEINNNERWQQKHWNSLQNCYRKTPYFKDYSGYFEDIYGKSWNSLSTLNEELIRFFLNELEIKTKVIKASDLQIKGEKSDLILDICKKTKAGTYYSGNGGRNYLNLHDFRQAGIEVLFNNYQHPQYSQIFGDFIPGLSIIDSLFNCGKERLSKLISGDN